MKVFAKGRCRGDGKLYTFLKFDSSDVKCVSAQSYVGTTEVPAHIVDLEGDGFVLAVPDFSSWQHVTLSIVGSRGTSTEITLLIDPRVYSIASKLNGIAKKELLAKVRNIDSSGLKRELAFTCDGLIPTESGYIARGFISGSMDSSVKEVVAFNHEGSIVAASSLFLNRFAGSDEPVGALDASAYSIEIPSRLQGLCLAARDEKGRYVGAFKSYKPFRYRQLVNNALGRVSDASADCLYPDWIAERRLTAAAAAYQREHVFTAGPKFSVIVPLYKTPLNYFRDMADSVIQQTYQNWELILVNSTPEEKELKQLVSSYAETDSRLKVVELESNMGITENTNAGIRVATGDFLCFFDHDDVLEPDILFEYASAIEADDKVDLLYCDEDKLLPDGTFGMPTFKPDFSLDMARDNNYICHLLTVRADAFRQIEPSGHELDGAQDHAMVLKIAELGGHIHHVAKILYHWRISETSTAGNSDSKPYATEAGIRAVQQHLDRLEIAARVSNSHGRAFRYRVDYLADELNLASIVVPTNGDPVVLTRFLRSLEDLEFKKWELVLVCSSDNVEAVSAIVGEQDLTGRARVVAASSPFSLSSWFNEGVRAAEGDCFVFMHDDAIFAESDSLSVLTGFAMREDVGIVGTMSCGDDGVIQQAGLSIFGDRVIPLSVGTHRSLPGYLFFPLTVRNVSAVDDSCFAVSRAAYERLGGFDESFRVDYASIDFSFAAFDAGLRVVYTPEAWVCHRTVTNALLRGDSNRKVLRVADSARLLSKWKEVFSKGDPYLNPSFSRSAAKASLYQIDHDGALTFGSNL